MFFFLFGYLLSLEEKNGNLIQIDGICTGEIFQVLTRCSDWLESIFFSFQIFTIPKAKKILIQIGGFCTGEVFQVLMGRSDWLEPLLFSHC